MYNVVKRYTRLSRADAPLFLYGNFPLIYIANYRNARIVHRPSVSQIPNYSWLRRTQVTWNDGNIIKRLTFIRANVSISISQRILDVSLRNYYLVLHDSISWMKNSMKIINNAFHDLCTQIVSCSVQFLHIRIRTVGKSNGKQSVKSRYYRGCVYHFVKNWRIMNERWHMFLDYFDYKFGDMCMWY